MIPTPNAGTAVSITGETIAVAEDSGSTQFTFLTSNPVPSNEVITIDFEIVPGTTTPRQDYEYRSATAVFIRQTGIYADRITIPGSASIGSFFVNVLQDQLLEGSEAFTVRITGVSPNASIGDNSSLSVTIEDDDKPENQVTIATQLDAAEPDQNGQFLVSLSQAAAVDTVIAYTVAGTATAEVDYTALTDEVTIPAGSISVPIDVIVVDDAELEGQETVIVTLDAIVSGDSSVELGSAKQDTLTITDDVSKVLYRLNAGGPEIAAIDDGPNWLADGDFLLNPGSSSVAQFSAVTPGATVSRNVPGAIFNTERFDAYNPVEMQYRFEVDPGFYKVNLYMGNGFEGTSAPKSRIFDVAIEEEIPPDVNNIDLSSRFGHLVGGKLSHVVSVTDGVLNIQFLRDSIDGIENPLVNGIEIVALSA